MDFHAWHSGEASTRVSAPPEVVWDLLADVARTREWSPECRGGRWLDGATGPEPGARFIAWNRKGPLRWYTRSRIVEAERGRVLAWEVIPPGSQRPVSRWTWRMQPDGDGALVTERFEVGEAPAYVRATWLLLGGSQAGRMEMLQRGVQTSVERVRALVEREVTAAG